MSTQSQAIRTLHALALALALLALGCSSDSQSNGTPSTVSAPIPIGISATVTSLGPLTAEVVVDGTTTFFLTVDLTAGTVSGTIDGLTPGSHTFVINFYSTTTAFGTVLIATVNVNADVVAGETRPVDFGSAPVTKPDTDSDGVSNLDELGYGLDPTRRLARMESVAAGGTHSCAVQTNHSLWCWGSNGAGQLGDGTAINQQTPIQEITEATDWAAVSTGSLHTCAIKISGSLWCWGSNFWGQLGDGSTTNRPAPIREATNATNWSVVSAGYSYTCAVNTAGTIWCWGDNGNSVLGDGSTTMRRTPTQENTAATDWATVSAGFLHTCAVKTSGTLWCWGDNGFGSLGDGTTVVRSTPTQESTASTNWAMVSARGFFNTCAVKTNGTLWCWGSNALGLIGDGTTNDRLTPTQENTAATDWATISVGLYHVCAVRASGTLWCWGWNSNGQLGDATFTTPRLTPTQAGSAVTNWAAVSAGDSHTCAVTTTNTSWCWGDNTNAQLGDGTSTERLVSTQESSAATNWDTVSTTGVSNHTCAVKTTGTLWCWGSNGVGQLGDGTTTNRLNPTQESTASADWSIVSGGSYDTCAVKTTGTLWCWGENGFGQLGNGTTSTQLGQTQESTAGADWATVSAGPLHTCAVKTTGTLWCWGDNFTGQLGDGTTTSRLAPIQERTNATDWTTVSSGDMYTCATKTTGTIWCWGYNALGQLGDGTNTDQLSPTRESSAAANWAAVSSGVNHTCAVKTTGTLWCWGENGFGKLGNNTIITVSTPTQESTAASNWDRVSAGLHHTCATKTTGTLWCWGVNGLGQLGDGTTTNRLSPSQESSAATNWTAVSAAQAHSCGVKITGTLWCWGFNLFGQLGTGPNGRALPEPVHLE